jgi:hypothetical protein
MKNHKRRNKSPETFLLASDRNSRARKFDSAPHELTHKPSLDQTWEASPGPVLSLAQSEPFIPWALYAVERAFLRVLQDEAERFSSQSES